MKTLQPSPFRPPHKNQVNSDLRVKSKSILIPMPWLSHFRPQYQNQVIFDPNTKTSQFRSLHWNQVKFDPPQWNQVNFDHPHKNEVKFDAHTKTKWFLASIPKPSQFRPPARKLGQLIPTLKTNRFRPALKTQANFDPHAKKGADDDP